MSEQSVSSRASIKPRGGHCGSRVMCMCVVPRERLACLHGRAERRSGERAARWHLFRAIDFMCSFSKKERRNVLYYSRSTADRTSSVESRVVRRRAVETPRVVHLARALSPLYRVPPAFLTTRDHTEHSTQIV